MSLTIKDIARESGYAVGTVSRVLNNHPDVSDKARTKIMEVVEKHHFKLNNNAKHLKQQASNGIAIIVKGNQNMLFASIVEQMQGMIRQKGYACLMYYIGEMEDELEQAFQVIVERRPMGILFLGSNLAYFKERFSSINIPCVLVTNSGESLGFSKLSSVSTDDSEAAFAAIEHLILLGHKRIGILGGQLEKSRAAITRYIGCRKAFEEHGIPFETDRQYEPALFSISQGYEAMERLMAKMPDLTAVFAMSDTMALGAIRAIRDRGLRVPEDISVVGFDGIELGNYMSPKLTTIRQDREIIAKRSVEILLGNIAGLNGAVHETVPFQIIVGESAEKR